MFTKNCGRGGFHIVWSLSVSKENKTRAPEIWLRVRDIPSPRHRRKKSENNTQSSQVL